MIEAIRMSGMVGGAAMMDIVLAGGMGFVLAVLLSNPPRQKARSVTTKVVEETQGSKAVAAPRRATRKK